MPSRFCIAVPLLLGLGHSLVVAKPPNLLSPSSVENQIREDAQQGSHTGKDFLAQWKEQKASWQKNLGFSLNSDYSAFYLSGNNSLDYAVSTAPRL